MSDKECLETFLLPPLLHSVVINSHRTDCQISNPAHFNKNILARGTSKDLNFVGSEADFMVEATILLILMAKLS